MQNSIVVSRDPAFFAELETLLRDHPEAGKPRTLESLREARALLRTLRETNPGLENSIFRSIHAVALDTMPGYRTGGALHSFLENYDE